MGFRIKLKSIEKILPIWPPRSTYNLLKFNRDPRKAELTFITLNKGNRQRGQRRSGLDGQRLTLGVEISRSELGEKELPRKPTNTPEIIIII